MIWSPATRHGNDWPTTNSWPTSSPLALVRESVRRGAGRAVSGDGSLRKQVVTSLPYSLTSAQKRALEEIWKDMASPPLACFDCCRADVGSGQNDRGLSRHAQRRRERGAGGTHGSDGNPRPTARRRAHAAVRGAGYSPRPSDRSGKGQVPPGGPSPIWRRATSTYSSAHTRSFRKVWAFNDLAFAVIDEQHRFGVHQRLALTAKAAGARANLLVMTATPIPRTLTMTAYGDMDSLATGRKALRAGFPVDTRAMPLERLDEVVQAVRRAVGDGDRVYWVCPLVEESDVIDIAAAEARYAALAENLGNDVALLHGRMKSAEKDAHMSRFAGGGNIRARGRPP